MLYRIWGFGAANTFKLNIRNEMLLLFITLASASSLGVALSNPKCCLNALYSNAIGKFTAIRLLGDHSNSRHISFL